MNFAAMLLPERIVDALGWTLFHSLWQGALVALGFAVVLYVSRRCSARIRYVLGLMALALALAASIATFWTHYAVAAPATVARSATAVAAEAPSALQSQAAAGAGRSFGGHVAFFFSDYFGRYLPLFVTLWLLGVLFLTLRFSGGLLYVQRLKYSQNRPLGGPWPERLRELAARAGLRRPLLLLESLRLRAPLVIGLLKPVLLMPAGLMTGLPADEVEALLAHELAHVIRRDYLINVLQNLLDILFFFHPGIRWISACVRQEREHCCDDFAVALCGDPQNYARALARLQVEAMGFPEPALAAAGRPRRLLRRIARLLARPRLVHDFREGFVSAMLLVVGLLAMLKLVAAAGGGAAPPVGSEMPAMKDRAASRFELLSFVLEADAVVKLSGKTAAASGPAPSTWVVDDNDGRVVWYMTLAAKAQHGAGMSFSKEIDLNRGAYAWYLPAGCIARARLKGAAGREPWSELPLNSGGAKLLSGRRRSEEELLRAENEEILLKKEEERRQLEERMKAETEAARMLKEEERLKREEELQLQAEKKRFEEEKEKQQQEEIVRALAEKKLSEEERRKLENELKAQADAERKLMEKDKLQYEEQLRAQAEAERRMKEDERLQYEEQKRQVEAAKQQEMEEYRLRQEEKRLQAEEVRLKIEAENLKKFIAELARTGLISEKDGYEIKLSPSALVINGKKQPQQVFEKYRQYYEAVVGRKVEGKHTVTFVGDKK